MYDIFDKLMKQKGVTMYRVSKDTKIAQATLIDWKNGKTHPKYDKMQKIAEYFNVPVDYLLTGEEKENPPAGYGEGKSEDTILFSAYKAAPQNVQEAIRNLLGLK